MKSFREGARFALVRGASWRTHPQTLERPELHDCLRTVPRNRNTLLRVALVFPVFFVTTLDDNAHNFKVAIVPVYKMYLDEIAQSSRALPLLALVPQF